MLSLMPSPVRCRCPWAVFRLPRSSHRARATGNESAMTHCRAPNRNAGIALPPCVTDFPRCVLSRFEGFSRRRHAPIGGVTVERCRTIRPGRRRDGVLPTAPPVGGKDELPWVSHGGPQDRGADGTAGVRPTPLPPPRRAERLAELWATGLLDSAPEAAFDDAVRLATWITGTRPAWSAWSMPTGSGSRPRWGSRCRDLAGRGLLRPHHPAGPARS